MKVYLLVVVAILAVGVWTPSLQGAGVKTHTFAELAMKADAIIVAGSVVPEPDGKRLKMSVKEVLLGDVGKEEIRVSFARVFRMKVPKEIKVDRLVFLSSRAGKFSLIGAGMQSVWPLGKNGGNSSYRYPYESARDLTSVVKMCKELIGFRSQDNPAKRTAIVSKLAGSDDEFLRLVGMQLCSYLRSSDRAKYQEQIEVGAAYALKSIHLNERDMLLYFAAAELAHAAPPSAVLRSLLNLIEHPSAGVMRQNNAFMHFVQISRTSGKFDFQHKTRKPDKKKRAETLKAIQKWFKEARPALVRADAPKILAALRSEDLLQRRIGRLWLESAARLTFDYDEKAKAEDRMAAMEKIEKWFQSFGAKTDPTPVPSTRPKELRPSAAKEDDGIVSIAAPYWLRSARIIKEMHEPFMKMAEGAAQGMRVDWDDHANLERFTVVQQAFCNFRLSLSCPPRLG